MMPRAPSAALLPLADALASLTAGVAAVSPCRLHVGAALGAVAAEDVPATTDLPSRLVALHDGWAVPFVTVAGASPHAPVLLDRLPAWRDAGEPLPAGADTVLPPEALDDGHGPQVVAEVPPGHGARPTGTDLRAGAILVAAGERVSALHMLALAATRIARVDVRVPRIKLVTTGPEAEHEAALPPALAALVARAGGRVMDVAALPGGVGDVADAIATGAADSVFVLGGTGFGRTDFSAAGLARAGTVRAHGVAIRPGETAAFGTSRDRPVLLLPGRPDAALSVFLALGRPLLRALSGEVERLRQPAPLLRKVSSAIGLSEIVFVRWEAGGLDPLGGAELPLHRLLRADGGILVPPDREGYPEGALVEMMPL